MFFFRIWSEGGVIFMLLLRGLSLFNFLIWKEIFLSIFYFMGNVLGIVEKNKDE